jgi:hypothetical protein
LLWELINQLSQVREIQSQYLELRQRLVPDIGEHCIQQTDGLFIDKSPLMALEHSLLFATMNSSHENMEVQEKSVVEFTAIQYSIGMWAETDYGTTESKTACPADASQVLVNIDESVSKAGTGVSVMLRPEGAVFEGEGICINTVGWCVVLKGGVSGQGQQGQWRECWELVQGVLHVQSTAWLLQPPPTIVHH